MNRTIRVVPALLAVVAVLLVAVAGTATAAKLVTGKQIRNGSLTSVDVRNNNLTGADLKNGTVAGADLRNGTISGADLAGGSVATDRLADDAKVFGYANGQPDIDLGNCPDQTLSVCPGLATVLTSGPQAVTVSGTLDNLENAVPTPTRCGLVYDGAALHTVQLAPNADGQPGDVVPFTLQAVVDVTGEDGYVQLRCTQFAGDDLHLRDVKLTAVTVHGLD